MSKEKKVLTDKQKLFLNFLVQPETQGDFRKAMRLAGYSEYTTVNEVIQGLKDEIIDAAKNIIAMNATGAAFQTASILYDGNKPGAGNILKAAKEILDRAGVAKTEENLQVNIPKGGIVIMPAKDRGLWEKDEKENETEITEDE